MKDITDVISKVELKEGTSKAGSKYAYIEITLINKGTERIFIIILQVIQRHYSI